MSASISDRMDQILDRFDDAWNGTTPPRIEDYLTEAAPDQRLPLLIELVRIDLERRLAAGERARLDETYLRRFPELFAEPPALVTLVKHEYELRRRNEPDLMPAEYLERFPQCQTELVAQLPTLDEIRDAEQQPKTSDAPVGLDLRGYELIETLGKGGMGEVYRCVDPALGRDLAIKVMKSEYGGRAEAARRFLREARVTGSLQHPGIVPIHNLGRLLDGRLHYTMRLVRGQTFAHILKEQAGKPEHLPYLLSIFEKICQAVAYAHSKRVIHRDLKPQNVMVDRFGEVQVMDWGLAKLLTPGDAGAKPEVATDGAGTRIHTESADAPLGLSLTGSGMGTPAYMPPEQALGEWDAVDERADVFALGSILCEILTGQPAYSGVGGNNDVYRRAKRGDVAEAIRRLQQCGAEAALLRLCRDCLAPAQADRPRDAEQVAQRVASYQAETQERLRRAELERASALLKAHAERKKRRWMLAALLLLLVGVSVSMWQANRAKKAESRARENEDRALLAAEAESSAKRKAQQAAESERQAKTLAQTRLDQVHRTVDVLTSIFHDLDPRAEEKGGSDLRQQLSQHLEKAAKQLEERAVGDAVAAARIQHALGKSLLNLGQTKLAIESLGKAVMTMEDKLGADHPDTLTSRNDLSTAYWSAGRAEDSIRLHEQNLKLYEAKFGPDHPHTLNCRQNLAVSYHAADRIADAIRLHELTLKQIEAKLGPDHPKTIGARNNLAVAYWSADRFDEAVLLFEKTLKQMEVNHGGGHPDTLTSRNNLAEAYRSAGRAAEALRLHELTFKQSEAKLGAEHPDTLVSRHNLANSYLDAGRSADAIRLHEPNLKMFEAKLGPNHPKTLRSMADLGRTYRYAGRYKEGVSVLETALQRGRKLSGGLPHLLATVPVLLANAYDADGQFAKAESISRDFLEQARRRFGPDNLRTLAALSQLGGSLLKQKKFRDAEPLLRQCLTILERKQPDNWITFNTRSALGEALLGQGKHAEAESLLVQGYQGMNQRQDKILPPPLRWLRLSEALERQVQLYEATDQKEKAADWRKKLQETKAAQKTPKT